MLEVAGDESLPVSAARAGEPAAWDALFRRFQLPLYAYVFELVRHEQTSLDLVQETFINAARHIRSLQSDAKFAGWLFGIAHQKCIQHWRKRSQPQNFTEELSEELPDEAGDPRDWLIRKERAAEFMEQLGRLPWPHRSVLVLHFLEDFSLEEIAGITGTEPGTVKSRMHYAKKALRKIIEENEA